MCYAFLDLHFCKQYAHGSNLLDIGKVEPSILVCSALCRGIVIGRGNLSGNPKSSKEALIRGVKQWRFR
jgi:hypothetical protein